jgi:hypothetical protein
MGQDLVAFLRCRVEADRSSQGATKLPLGCCRHSARGEVGSLATILRPRAKLQIPPLEGVKKPLRSHSGNTVLTTGLAPYPRISYWAQVRSTSFMRLSLQKAAHATMGGAAYRKSGSERALCARCGIPRTSTVRPNDARRVRSLSTRQSTSSILLIPPFANATKDGTPRIVDGRAPE